MLNAESRYLRRKKAAVADKGHLPGIRSEELNHLFVGVPVQARLTAPKPNPVHWLKLQILLEPFPVEDSLLAQMTVPTVSVPGMAVRAVKVALCVLKNEFMYCRKGDFFHSYLLVIITVVVIIIRAVIMISCNCF
jgi:hypothetical protein